MRRFIKLVLLLAATVAVGFGLKRWVMHVRSSGSETVESRLQQFSAAVERRLKPDFEKAGVAYPPAQLILVGLKQERQLEVYAANAEGKSRFIRSYPVQGASGKLGPKLREGDRQVPEGLYGLEYLNPNSAYHLSMKVTYPNDFDRARGQEEGRMNLGGDIMIHGKTASIGCLAMGDEAAEDLFVLAALTGLSNVKVILSPVDFRKIELPADADVPAWTAQLYPQIREALAALSRH